MWVKTCQTEFWRVSEQCVSICQLEPSFERGRRTASVHRTEINLFGNPAHLAFSHLLALCPAQSLELAAYIFKRVPGLKLQNWTSRRP
jgi:hypothetical protein